MRGLCALCAVVPQQQASIPTRQTHGGAGISTLHPQNKKRRGVGTATKYNLDLDTTHAYVMYRAYDTRWYHIIHIRTYMLSQAQEELFFYLQPPQ